jgi:ribosomal protein S18 acetylase RimI-like enzyme
MTNVDVRAVRMSDEGEILALVREEMSALERIDPRFKLRPDAMGRYANYLRERTRELDSAVFVAEHEGRVVGLGIASTRGQATFFEPVRTGYISDLLVDPALRRRGVGTLLLDRMTKWFRGLGLEVVRLHVASCNEEARRFWRARGASDFLVESWIDITGVDRTPVIEDGRAHAQPAPSPGLAWSDDLAGGV